MYKKLLIYTFLACIQLVCTAMTGGVMQDTLKVVDIEEVVVIGSPKESGKLRQLPTTVSLISAKDMAANHVTALKEVQTMVPNFYMPDYGSKLTSAVYIRGIGSRINTPAVGLYVDNVPYIDKSAFDFNFFDIERIDVLRGPQGTLYGRNTMAGLVKVHTKSPFDKQGTDVRLGYGVKDNHRTGSLMHHHRLSDNLAFSAGGYYEESDGFFKHDVTGIKVDDMISGGFKTRVMWLPNQDWKVNMALSYDYSREGAYPYFYEGTATNDGEYNLNLDDRIGRILNNRESSYKRGMWNASVNLTYEAPRFTLNAVTGYQNLSDRMFMDQDFMSEDIYTLEQKQRLNTISEEITLKSRKQTWEWLWGASMYHQWLKTHGPVTFYEDGMGWLESTINGYMPDLSAKGITMGLKLQEDPMEVAGDFDTPVQNVALFHQSTLHLGERLTATAGLRLDYEHTSMTYLSEGELGYDFNMSFMKIPLNLKDLVCRPKFEGKLKDDYLQLLPKFALKYDFNKDVNVYASVARGFRSGGYNVQMFSELIQADMRNGMMGGVKQGAEKTLEGLRKLGMPSSVIERIEAGINLMPTVEVPTVEEVTRYKPEYSWNYEVGTHITTWNGRIQADAAVFFMDTRNQQIARFVESGLGRMMVNAGSSRSYGAEASLKAQMTRQLQLTANYGYTHATFHEYDGGNDIDYSGNYVPYVPMFTLNAGANYTFFMNSEKIKSLTLGLAYASVGKTYWNESNTMKQDAYGMLNGSITLDTQLLQLVVWGKNLTNTQYDTFRFETMQRIFAQKGKPWQLGVDVRFHF